MLYEWYEKGILMYVLAAISGIGMLLKFVLWHGMNGWLHVSEKMENEGTVWIDKVKLEYQKCCQNYGKVNNVDIFVDKHLGNCRYFGMRLSTWGKISGQIMALMIGIIVFSIAVGIVYKQDAMRIMFEFFVGCWLVLINLVVDNLASREEKEAQLRLNLLEYFENHPLWMGQSPEAAGKPAEGTGETVEDTAVVDDHSEAIREEADDSEVVEGKAMSEESDKIEEHTCEKEAKECTMQESIAEEKTNKASDSRKKRIKGAVPRREEIKQQLIKEREQKRAELARELLARMAEEKPESEKSEEQPEQRTRETFAILQPELAAATEKSEQGLIAEVLREFLQ